MSGRESAESGRRAQPGSERGRYFTTGHGWSFVGIVSMADSAAQATGRTKKLSVTRIYLDEGEAAVHEFVNGARQRVIGLNNNDL